MVKEKAVRLPNGQLVYMEVGSEPPPQDVEQIKSYAPPPPGEPVSNAKREGDTVAPDGSNLKLSEDLLDSAVERARSMTRVIEGVAALIPTAFRNAGQAEVEKVTLSFGIKIGAQGGIPLLTKANGEGSVGIVLECRYPRTEKGDEAPT